MNELHAILEAVNANSHPLYLATVVDVVGSSYRRPTARMLILPDGEHIGTISGGCLERDVCRAAADCRLECFYRSEIINTGAIQR